MIAQVEEAEKKDSFIVFLFHGVGGEHALNIDLEEHRKLLEYLKKRKKIFGLPPWWMWQSILRITKILQISNLD